MRNVRSSAMLSLLLLSLLAAPLLVAAQETASEEAAPAAESSPVPVPAPAPLPPSEVGRYHLLEAQYTAISATGEQTAERHLFKLDSVTGSIWVGRQVQFVDKKSGRLVLQRYWEPFEQYLMTPQAR